MNFPLYLCGRWVYINCINFCFYINHTCHVHDKYIVTETLTPIRYFYVFPLYFVQFVVTDDELLLGRNMLH
jgi:hypothetical protein